WDDTLSRIFGSHSIDRKTASQLRSIAPERTAASRHRGLTGNGPKTFWAFKTRFLAPPGPTFTRRNPLKFNQRELLRASIFETASGRVFGVLSAGRFQPR